MCPLATCTMPQVNSLSTPRPSSPHSLPFASAPLSFLPLECPTQVSYSPGLYLEPLCHAHQGSMAWVGRDGRLLFGRLEPELSLRWTTAYIGESEAGPLTAGPAAPCILMADPCPVTGDTPHRACFHAASRCFVVLSQDVAGDSWLRLVHADTLLQVLSMK